HVTGDALLREGEVGQRLFHLLAADQRRDEVQLLRRGAQHLRLGEGFVVGHAARILFLAHGLLPLGFLVGGVTVVGPRRRVFTELLADHLLGDVHRDVLLAVIDAEGEADELRQDGGAARPDLDHFRLARGLRLFRLLQKVAVDEGAFPDRTRHGLPPFLRVARANDVLVGRLVLAGLVALGALAPRGDRVAATAGAAFAAAVGVVDGVHGHTADRRANAHVTLAAGLAEVLVRMVGVRDRAHRRHAFLADHAKLARREADLRVAAVTADELRVGAGGARQFAALARLQLDVVGDPTDRHARERHRVARHDVGRGAGSALQLAALAGLQLDGVDDRTDRHAQERHRVARLDVGLGAGDDIVARGDALRRQDIGLLAVLILHQRDEGGPVRIVFDPLDRRRNVELATLEIHDPVETLRAPAFVPHRDASGVVPAAGLDEALGEGLDRTTFPKLRTVDQNQPTLARRRRLVRLECHALCLPLLWTCRSSG